MADLTDRNKKNYEFLKELEVPYPKNMLVEITNACNHKCIFCENRKMTRKKGYINQGLLEKLLQEAYALGTREVGYYATGEPLMCKDLPYYIKLAKEIGFEYVYITTNGALMTEGKIRDIVEAGIDSIKFSINAGTKDNYKLIHGKDDFEKVIENLIRLYEFRVQHDLKYKIYVSFVKTKQNEDEYEILKDRVREYVDDIAFFNVYNQGGNMYELNGIVTLEDDYKPMSAPCYMLFNRFHITYEGYLNICCVDFQNYLAIADLNVRSLKEAWQCREITEIRKRHLKNDLYGTVCYNCIHNTNEQVQPLVEEYATTREKDLEKDMKIIKETLNI